MKICAEVDTNVLVAALLSKKDDSATVGVVRAMLRGEFIPLYHEDILAEYDEVLHRKKKYNLSDKAIQILLKGIRGNGIEVFPKPTGEILSTSCQAQEKECKQKREYTLHNGSPYKNRKSPPTRYPIWSLGIGIGGHTTSSFVIKRKPEQLLLPVLGQMLMATSTHWLFALV